MVVPELVGDKFKGYNIADNQTATIAEWADDELRQMPLRTRAWIATTKVYHVTTKRKCHLCASQPVN